MLSDVDILDASSLGRIGISPFNRENLQPASYDLTVADEFWVMKREIWRPVKLDEDNDFRWERVDEEKVRECGFSLMPGEFALARTVETVMLGDGYAGRVEGRSSFGRLGGCVHATAGFIDPGFYGTITLELSNLGIAPIIIPPGRRICQLSVFRLETPSMKPYDSTKYKGQTGVRLSKIHMDRELVK